jgi:hypothetical protein
MLLINKENKSGPRTEPCGTPWVTGARECIIAGHTLSSIGQLRPDK